MPRIASRTPRAISSLTTRKTSGGLPVSEVRMFWATDSALPRSQSAAARPPSCTCRPSLQGFVDALHSIHAATRAELAVDDDDLGAIRHVLDHPFAHQPATGDVVGCDVRHRLGGALYTAIHRDERNASPAPHRALAPSPSRPSVPRRCRPRPGSVRSRGPTPCWRAALASWMMRLTPSFFASSSASLRMKT